ncbi:MAG: ABC transporter ATP-binding protein [Planctomycetes bacterium]|nr:ABC transporter ATP-binding protein [Planctomycetota bacterium]
MPPWLRYFSLLRPEARDVVTIVVYGAAGAVLTLAVPLTVDALVSNIMFGTLLTPLVVLVGVLLGCLVLHGILRALQIDVAEVIERRIFVRVAGDLAWRLPRVQIRAFDTRYGPELVNRFFDTVTLQKTTSKLVIGTTNVMLQSGVGMTVLAFYHPFLLILAAFLLLAVLFIVFVLGWRGVRTAIGESIAKYEVAAWLQEMARHTTAFCTHGGAEFARQRTDLLVGKYVNARRTHYRIWLRQVCSTLFLQVIASTAVLGIGGWLVIDQQLTPGQLVASELIVTAVVANVTKFADVMKDWYDACAAADKLGHLIDLPLERQTGAELPAGGGGVGIEVHGVTCGHPASPQSLHEFNLSVRPGERIALVGSTGGSASYLLDVLLGLREPLHGHVTVEGLDLRQLRLDSTRDVFALVHGTELVEGSILDNLRFGRENIGPDQIRDALEAVGLWDDVLELPLGLDTQLSNRGQPLSSGQASRLMLARAILGEPRLLLLDGAIDVLTPTVRKRVLAHLFDRRHRWTVLIVTQEPDVVAACDRHIDFEAEGAPSAGPRGSDA